MAGKRRGESHREGKVHVFLFMVHPRKGGNVEA